MLTTSKKPTPRPGVYELYWKFAYERQRAFEARVSGKRGPWSADPILQQYKFCNVFRAADRVSQYMIRDVAYQQDDSTPQDRLFQIVAFRTFSNIRTWNSITQFLGNSPRIEDLVNGDFERALDDAKSQHGGLYTGAFILCATNAYGRSIKHLNHVELFRDMFVGRQLGNDLLDAKSLEQVYELLHRFPLMGDFMSYQTAIDLNYSEYVNFSENDFTQPGPGAVRGMKKVFLDLGGLTPREAIMWMVDNQEAEFERLGYNFNGLWGRRIHGIDAQGLFCETDKYCREAVPELTSARSRIKARFSASAQSMELFFPPKWGINGRIPTGQLFGSRQPTSRPVPMF
ncbi:putative DNA base hypermodification protein [Rathayibacter festucae]|uniref:nucleotide kinase domain-containing protein n=1 Tax=Rathayibacter festucae TaxID=110937 RepID=UPI001FB4B6B5|nr:nucleotide kinase domain-containing protein [Rathayibacter festucae]MCJ1699332.1 putative DNA base hypermodification protein [Rathayibacter festucae]